MINSTLAVVVSMLTIAPWIGGLSLLIFILSPLMGLASGIALFRIVKPEVPVLTPGRLVIWGVANALAVSLGVWLPTRGDQFYQSSIAPSLQGTGFPVFAYAGICVAFGILILVSALVVSLVSGAVAATLRNLLAPPTSEVMWKGWVGENVRVALSGCLVGGFFSSLLGTFLFR